ncbi:MAG TPA: alanine--tRNA ligase [Burkholderiaceae bacterium]|nr:alanine--tRNA ligase [Burkholderiaceae bacterium]
MNSAEIRERFLKFFESNGHTIVRASSLVPANDPTLLFTNSGMVQFKDVFTGRETRPYKRATTAQKCLRAGGKHNDLENVGYTARHHTFFEMLGNFSFGDYFKREAIGYAWQLLTRDYRLPPEKLWVTVYIDDDEAYSIWTREIGVPASRCIRIGDKPGQPKYTSDNFWQMADTGPCGPCTEIFYDHGPQIAGGPPGSDDADGDRFIEIWNLVFMQFDRDPSGQLTPLPRPCVDTGMGLERLAAVLQGVHSNYDIDLFQRLIRAAARETGTRDLADNSLKVIADHIRACAFLVADGVIPGNEGRGYVLRRIVRRALRHGYKLGCRKPFFYRLASDVAQEMGAAYPELVEGLSRIEAVLLQEEQRFGETLENGMKILDAALGQLRSGDARMLDGETAFVLYDTHGFPVDLTADIARERGFTVDMAGFERAMERQREQARAEGRFRMSAGLEYEGDRTRFVGYERLRAEARVVALYAEGVAVPSLRAGQTGVVVLDTTPFYAEGGGQVGDRGELAGTHGTFRVEDTQKVQPEVFGHHGALATGTLRVGDAVEARVDAEYRARTMLNHSATHLMHAALRTVLGGHVQQKGSRVDAERTRFDFSHDKPMDPGEVRRVEAIVNRAIRANVAVSANVMKFDEAIDSGALAFFGDKYGDEVRVVAMGADGENFSTELCGGTHVRRTGDIGFFKVVAESGIASGVRRIEAVTGAGALEYVQWLDAQLASIAASVRSPVAEANDRVVQILEDVRAKDKEIARLKSKLAAGQGDELATRAVVVGSGLKVLAATLDGADARTLRETLDQLKNKLKSAAIVLASVEDGKVQIAAGVTPDAVGRIKAGDLANFVASQVGGKGGGRPDMAMAGGNDPAALPSALDKVQAWVEQRL